MSHFWGAFDDKEWNMNYIQSEDKFQCTRFEVCSNTDEFIKKHFDEDYDDENKS